MAHPEHFTFNVDVAPSGRALCERCGEPIEKGVVRFGRYNPIYQTFGPHRHVECFIQPRKHRQALKDLVDIDTLEETDKTKVRRALEGKLTPRPTALQHVRRSRRGREPVRDITHTRGFRELRVQHPDVVAKYEKMLVPEIKRYLRFNNQVLYGTKAELVDRAVEAEVNGPIPLCPFDKGRLHLEELRVQPPLKKKRRKTLSDLRVKDLRARLKKAGLPTSGRKAELVARIRNKGPTRKEMKENAEQSDMGGTKLPGTEYVCKGNWDDDLELFVRCHYRSSEHPFDVPVRAEWKDPGPTEGFPKHRKKEPKEPKEPQEEKEPQKSRTEVGKPEKSVHVANEKNRPLVSVLHKLAVLMKAQGDSMFAVSAEAQAAKSVAACPFEITDGTPLSVPGPNKLVGVGKFTAGVMNEFLQTGKAHVEVGDRMFEIFP